MERFLLALLLSSPAGAAASEAPNAGHQRWICSFRDLPGPDRVEVLLASPETGTFQYLPNGGSSPAPEAPLEVKRLADEPSGLASFEVLNAAVKMTFKVPSPMIFQNAQKARGVLTSVIEDLNLTQSQELLCDAEVLP